MVAHGSVVNINALSWNLTMRRGKDDLKLSRGVGCSSLMVQPGVWHLTGIRGVLNDWFLSNRTKREGSLQTTENPLQEYRNRRAPYTSFQVFWRSERQSSNPRTWSPGVPTCHFRVNPHPPRMFPVFSAGSGRKVSLRLKGVHGPWKSFLAQTEANPSESSPLIFATPNTARQSFSLRRLQASGNVTSGHLAVGQIRRWCQLHFVSGGVKAALRTSSFSSPSAPQLGRCSVLNRVGDLTAENASRPIKFKLTTM